MRRAGWSASASPAGAAGTLGGRRRLCRRSRRCPHLADERPPRLSARCRSAARTRADRDRLALARRNLGDDARDGRRNLDVDFVGGHLDEGIAFGNEVADVLAPLDDRAFGNGLAHFGKRYADQGAFQNRLHFIFSGAGGLRLRTVGARAP